MPEQGPRWPMFQRVWRRAALTDRMIDELGIEPIIAARLDKGEAYRQACTICLTCPAARPCRNQLDLGEGLASVPNYCPNRHFFEACLERQLELH